MPDSTPHPAAPQGKIRAALKRWFGGWTFVSVGGPISHVYLGNTSSYVAIGPCFYAIPDSVPPRLDR